MVTGAASGIGLGLAHRFGRGMRGRAGRRRARRARRRPPLADIGADGVLAVPTDVRDDGAVDALAAAAFERFGAAHVLCNNAGVGVGGLAWTVPADRWRWIVDVNLLGVAHGIRVRPRMIEQGEGHVVNTASAAGTSAGPAMAPYYATKHGVVALSESLTSTCSSTGRRRGVSVLCPEWVRTDIGDADEVTALAAATVERFAAQCVQCNAGVLVDGLALGDRPEGWPRRQPAGVVNGIRSSSRGLDSPSPRATWSTPLGRRPRHRRGGPTSGRPSTARWPSPRPLTSTCR